MSQDSANVLYSDDRRRVAQLLKGDERAFREFFHDHYPRLYRFALARLSQDFAAAEDVAQLTLSKALRNLAHYRGESQLFTWLCAICRSEITDWLRKQGRYRAHVVATEDHPEIQAAIDSLEAPGDDPQRALQRTEAIRLIQVALDRLPPRYGDALEWKYVEGLSAQEIAERLNLKLEAANSLLARAKRAFKEVYAPLAAGAVTISGSEAT